MYIACFTFEVLDGELDDYLKVNVTYNGKVYQGDYDETLGYWYSFYCSEEYVEPIVTLTNHLINIDNPEVDKMPSYTATAENCIVTVEKWMYNRPGNVDLVEMGEEETFDYGVAYFAQLSITPYYGYELAGELTFSNGVQEGDEIVNDGTITVLVRFDEVIETITIYEIRMMLPEALGGNTISSNNASSLTNSGYYSITTNWHRITNPSVENLEYVDIEENEAFEVGSIYLVTFTFNPAQGVNLDKAAVYLTYKETDTLLQNDETLGYYYFIFCIEDVVIK